MKQRRVSRSLGLPVYGPELIYLHFPSFGLEVLNWYVLKRKYTNTVRTFWMWVAPFDRWYLSVFVKKWGQKIFPENRDGDTSKIKFGHLFI